MFRFEYSFVGGCRYCNFTPCARDRYACKFERKKTIRSQRAVISFWYIHFSYAPIQYDIVAYLYTYIIMCI